MYLILNAKDVPIFVGACGRLIVFLLCHACHQCVDQGGSWFTLYEEVRLEESKKLIM